MNVELEMKEGGELLSSGNLSAAIVRFRNVYEKYPNNVWSLTYLIKSLVLKKDIINAIPYIHARVKKVSEAHPSDKEFIFVVNQFFKHVRLQVFEHQEYLLLNKAISELIYSWCVNHGYSTNKIDLLEHCKEDSSQASGNKEKNVRVAVLISGQLRGYQRSIKSIKEFIDDVTCDIYFAAWDRAGFRDITSDKRSYSHLARTFDADFCHLVKKLGVDLTGYIDASLPLKEVLNYPVSKSTITKIYPNSHVKILSESSFETEFDYLQKKLTTLYGDTAEIFARGVNMMKMVYANYEALNMAKSSGNNYTHILKLRPDFVITSKYSLKELLNSKIMSQGYSFLDSWSDEVSDQFYFGSWNDGNYYNNLWEFWLQNQMKVDDIGNLFKPHKRIKDYLRYGNIPYVLLPSIRDDLDSSNKILKSDHINLVKSDYSGFKQKATKEQILFFEEYSSTS